MDRARVAIASVLLPLPNDDDYVDALLLCEALGRTRGSPRSTRP